MNPSDIAIVHVKPGWKSDDPRIKRAAESHDYFTGFPVRKDVPKWRTAKSIGDERDYPFLRDMLVSALLTIPSSLQHGRCGAIKPDREVVIVMTPDDSYLPYSSTPNARGAVKELAAKVPCFTGQRLEVSWGIDAVDTPPHHCRWVPEQKGHQGRCLIAWRRDWLLANFDKIPDLIMGPCALDLAMTAMIRRENGRPWSMETAHELDPVCDLPAGTLLHEKHESAWLENENTGPANVWNRKLVRKWFEENMPDKLPIHLKNV